MIKQIGVYNGSSWDLQNIGASAENIILPNSQLGASTLNELLGKLLPSQEFDTNRVLLTGNDRKLISSQITKTELECLLGCTSNIQNALDSVIGEVNPFSSKIEIISGTNIKTLLTPGNYYCSNATVAGTLTNAPWSDRGFNLLVFSYPIGSTDTVVHLAYPNTAEGYIRFRICADRTAWSSSWRSLTTGEGDLSSYLTRTTGDSLYATKTSLSSYYTKSEIDAKKFATQASLATTNSNVTNLTTKVNTINSTLSNIGTAITGTKVYSSAFTMNASTLYNIASISLPAGTWIVESLAAWNNSSGGDSSYRASYLSLAKSGDTARTHGVAYGAATAGNTAVHNHMIIKLSATTTYYANVQIGKAATFQPGSSGIWATRLK